MMFKMCPISRRLRILKDHKNIVRIFEKRIEKNGKKGKEKKEIKKKRKERKEIRQIDHM